MLDIPASGPAGPGFLHPTLLWEGDAVVLVDAGYPRQSPQLREAVERAGVPFARLNTVIITHHDIDHVGSLAALREALPGQVRVLCQAEEKPFLEGTKPAIKVAGMEANLAALPEQMQAVCQSMKRFYAANQVQVDRALGDGERLPWCGGIRVIHTPGHTPGHLCLYLERSKTLVAGDALTVQGGRLVKGPDSYDWRSGVARESLRKLTQYDIRAIISYHGGLYQENVNERLAEVAAEEAKTE